MLLFAAVGNVVGSAVIEVGSMEGMDNELGITLMVGAIDGVPVAFVGDSLGEIDIVGNSETTTVGVIDTEGDWEGDDVTKKVGVFDIDGFTVGALDG